MKIPQTYNELQTYAALHEFRTLTGLNETLFEQVYEGLLSKTIKCVTAKPDNRLVIESAGGTEKEQKVKELKFNTAMYKYIAVEPLQIIKAYTEEYWSKLRASSGSYGGSSSNNNNNNNNNNNH